MKSETQKSSFEVNEMAADVGYDILKMVRTVVKNIGDSPVKLEAHIKTDPESRLGMVDCSFTLHTPRGGFGESVVIDASIGSPDACGIAQHMIKRLYVSYAYSLFE